MDAFLANDVGSSVMSATLNVRIARAETLLASTPLQLP